MKPKRLRGRKIKYKTNKETTFHSLTIDRTPFSVSNKDNGGAPEPVKTTPHYNT